jgi:beta-galactosidase/beta-glucuronidase
MRREEYPRPQLVRDKWFNLNGLWEFTFDDSDLGMIEKWYLNNKKFKDNIEVPFVFQTKMSGIDSQENHEIVWYKKRFELPENFDDEKVLLHFGAVDFETKVFVNESLVGEHIGGHTPFTFDITPYLNKEESEQVLAVRVFDPRYDERIPRGKQTWQEKPHSIWYTNTTGIWQTVWLENVSESYIKDVYFTPDIDDGSVSLRVDLNQPQEQQLLSYTIKFKDELVASGKWHVHSPFNEMKIQLNQQNIYRSSFHDNGWDWSPEEPNLFDVTLKLYDNEKKIDEIESYFGMRKVHIDKGMVYLNNKPYYQKLVLDQGYWPESLMTAPTDEALKLDIELAKEMGFNGCRKHQKVEDPRFLYWADKLGFLVWGESGSAHSFSDESIDLVTEEWKEIVKRDYNHPSIITWVPFNESWGIGDVARDKRQQHYTQALYHLIHALDPTRLVISNDGWEMTVSDIAAVHNYQHGQVEEVEKFEKFKKDISTKTGVLNSQSANRQIYADGYSYQGEPILLTEFGGIGYKVGAQDGWGYTTVASEEEYLSEYGRVLDSVFKSNVLFGFCYTQLYDVEQEINGILSYNREPKCSLAKIKEINSQYHPNTVSVAIDEG